MDRIHQPQPQPSPFAAPWPDGVTARYLTKAAEITGNLELTVNVHHDGAKYVCTGCGDSSSLLGGHRIHGLAQGHAEKCRALPRPAVTR